MPPMTPHGGDAADFASTWQEICARIQALEGRLQQAQQSQAQQAQATKTPIRGGQQHKRVKTLTITIPPCYGHLLGIQP